RTPRSLPASLVESEDRLVDPIVGDFFADPDEPALLRDALRSDIGRHDMRRYRPVLDLLEQEPESRGREPLSPVVATDPVADLTPAVVQPAHDVAHDLVVREDRT